MTVLDRFIALSFTASYFILLSVGVGFYIFGHLLANIDEFTADMTLPPEQVLRVMFSYYANNIPLYYSQLAGPVMAIAAAFTLGGMLRRNEMTPLAAAGLPLQRLALPVMGCGVVLAALWIANRELLIPARAEPIARSYQELLRRESGGVHCACDADNAILTALRLFPRAGRIEAVNIIVPDAAGVPASLIEADAAVYDESRKTWRLERGRQLILESGGRGDALGAGYRYEPLAEYAFGLGPAELVLRQSSEWADLMSLPQMNALMRTQNIANRPTVEMSRHVRLTTPLVQLTLLLLTLPFFLSRAPTNVLAAGGRALLLAGLFYAATFLAHGLAPDATWAPLAAWAPVLLFGPVAVLRLAGVRT